MRECITAAQRDCQMVQSALVLLSSFLQARKDEECCVDVLDLISEKLERIDSRLARCLLHD